MDLASDRAGKPLADSRRQPPGAAPPPPPPPPNSSDSTQPHSHPHSDSTQAVTWSSDLNRRTPPSAPPNGDAPAAPVRTGHNPDANPSPADYDNKNTMETVKNVLSRWGKKVGEKAKAAESFSRDTWQHLKTGPSLVDAAMGRLAQGTKVIAEGGYEKIFRQTFDAFPDEQLIDYFVCYLSTSAGPIMGVLYLTTAKLAFSSDNPLPYKSGQQTEWSHFKIAIPLPQLMSIVPSISKTNTAEKYIQIVSVDNHEFWFMGFLNYDTAVHRLQEALRDMQKEA
ncbi:GEM-like protein 1 [Zingiber officinale]|uniref:GRAM domain-containing protein n=1 Tax=Zingiber officinale TaxID=94328 RepID=A0A8J5ET97_ZINOF|nr:GEM-like protein 1 [Zingiber officinale]KAG6474425.1 hypothetical protein ZIOFF_068360 [Zingiber officinale]